MPEITYGSKTTAPLTNVGLFMGLLEKAINRGNGLPGMVVFSGRSGYGKSSAANYAYQSEHNPYYVVCRSVMTRKAFLATLIKEMGLKEEQTITAMYERAVAELLATGRPLIIDEFDYLVQKSAVDIVRDLHDEGRGVIALIGEEALPKKLKRWERFDGRIFDWDTALPATRKDCTHLVKLYCPGVELSDDLIAHLHSLARGSVRRICVNLSHIADVCHLDGLDFISLDGWGNRELHTGEAQIRRTV